VVVAEGGGGNEALEGVSGVGKLRQSEGHLGKRRWEVRGSRTKKLCISRKFGA
jgi:hypothetical protein